MIRIYLLLAMAGLMSCTPQTQKREVYSVLYDTTDPLQATPKAEALWQFINADATDAHLHIRYAVLSDVDMNVVRQLERSAEQSGLFSNAINEKKRLEGFKHEFNALLKQTDSIGASHSAIFKPLLEELEYLASLTTTDTKHLIVFSNMVENSDWMTYYRGNDLWYLRYKSDVIIKRYLEQVPQDANYRDVKLHIVYKPTNYQDNIRFKQLREVYKQVFKQLNVPITFSANLTKANDEI